MENSRYENTPAFDSIKNQVPPGTSKAEIRPRSLMTGIRIARNGLKRAVDHISVRVNLPISPCLQRVGKDIAKVGLR